MKAAAVLAVSILASAGVAFSVASLMRPDPPAPLDPLEAEILEIRQAQLALQQGMRRDLAALESRLEALVTASTRTAVPEISDDQIERVVARVIEARGQPVEAAAPAAGELDLQSIHTSLLGSNPGQFPQVWQRVKEAGLLDELVGLFEEAANANPDLPQVHMDLGNAYLQKLMSMTPGPQSGVVATQVEEAFGRVLEIDPNHWAARFTRAMSYTFWPDFLGRKQQAIDQFEILISQQEQVPPEPHYAQTYLFLGNLYEQRGDLDKAAEVWSKGLTLFPADAGLKSKVK